MQRFLILIAIASIALSTPACKNDRGTVLNFPFWGADNSKKNITNFSIKSVTAEINGASITLTLPSDTNVTNLAASFIITGVKVEVNGEKQVNGVTLNDFSQPVTYTVFAIDGSTKDYIVTVTVAPSQAKDITQFTILGIDGTIGINTIALTVPYATDRLSLTPTITITGASINPASGVARNFTNPVTYTVTAADGSTKDYTVTVNVAASYDKDITQFTILGIDGTIGTNTIALTVPYGTDRSSLTPTITITGASVSPASGVPRNFTNPVTYTVKAADGTPKDYTVTVSVAANPAKDITDFVILGIHGTISANTIALTMPYGTDRSSLTPTITHTGASISPLSGVPVDFTNPVLYTVTATDTTTKVYTVTVSVAASPAKDITQFTILGIDGAIGADTIALTVPYGTDRSSLTPAITITGASVSPASGVPRNFTNPVTYTVTAADGTTKGYTVIVSVAANPAKDITQFTIMGIDGAIGANTITLTVPSGTDISSLTPTITITGASVNPASGTAQDFRTSVTYTVTAADNSTKVYTITVTEAPADAKDITDFVLLGMHGAIGTDTITLTMPYGTDISNLTPTIKISGTGIDPASGVAQDFTDPVTYTVTAGDATTKVYTITVSVAANPAKNITQFTILGIDGTIGANTIALTVPYGTDRSSLTPTIEITGASINPASGLPRDFTNPVTYTVTAADGSTKDYIVTVSEARNPAKEITDFVILSIHGTIGANTVTLTVPFGTNRSNLTPAITILGASISPASNVPQNFTNPVMYTVTAADTTTKVYTVTVSVAANPAKDITQFTILGNDGVIEESTGTITVSVPYGTPLASLSPAIIYTGVSVSPDSGEAVDFSIPVDYTVTAADGSTKVYTVTVNADL